MALFTQFDSIAGATALTDALLGADSGIAVLAGSIKLTASGAPAVNLYDGSLQLGIAAGLLLTSGTTPGTSNTVGWFGTDNSNWSNIGPDGLPVDFFNGDPVIDSVVNTVFQTQSYDATTLGFQFTVSDPSKTSISFDIVFGSDEYPEWVDQFVDCAVVIVNGVNYALFNHDPLAPLSVISPNLAAGYFQDNAGKVLPIEYDGVSHVLKIVAPIKPGEVNSIVIGIADTGDHIYDSGIFIANMRAGTTPGSGVVITPDVPCTDGPDVVSGSVADDLFDLKAGDDVAYAGGGDDIVVAGIGNDTVYGGSGNDVLEGDAGDDHLDGGDGTLNQAVYKGASGGYTIAYDSVSGTYAVTDTATGAEGVDTLKSIQLVKFANGLYDLTPDGLTPHATNPGVPANQPGSVVISGAAVVGQTLTAIVVDGDGVPASGVNYQWKTSTDGTTWSTSAITSETYTVAEGDAGHAVMVEVAYTDSANHAEAPASATVKVAAKGVLSLKLLELSAPTGAGVKNPLTTLLNNAMSLGFSANEATVAIKTVLGLPDIGIKTYDPVAVLSADSLDVTALAVLKICGELAMAASASDATAFNLTLAVMDAAVNSQTINLANKDELAALLIGISETALGIVQTTNKDMADAPTVYEALAAWNDFCGHTDYMESYKGSFGWFNVDLNQAPIGFSTAALPPGSVDTAYTISDADLLPGFTDPDGDALSIVDVVPDGGGTIADNGDGTWTFTPNPGFAGPVEIGFTVSDPSSATVSGNAMFVITAPVPPPPVDTTAPTVASIAYGTNDGTLKAGETVALTVTLSEAVTVAGTPTIALNSGGVASYISGSDTDTLTFSYTVVTGENTADLATSAAAALSGAIADAAGNAVVGNGFNDVNPTGSLPVDTTAPTVASIAYGSNDGTLKAGETIALTVTLSEAVNVAGTPTVALANGGSATYSSGSGTDILTFTYTVAAGQDTVDLATAASAALSGAIADPAGNGVIAAEFNGVNPVDTLKVDTIAPMLSTFSPADGSAGVAVGTNIVLTFAEPIARGAGTISIRQSSASGTVFESFDAATSTRVAISGSALTIDPTSNLANGTSYFVVFGDGSVTDSAGNACGGVGTYDFTTAPAGNVITGTTNADTLNGTAGIDVIYGLSGSDLVTGAAGTDFLDGGDGSDVYIVAAAAHHGAAEFADSGAIGTDQVRFTAITAGTLTLYAGDSGIERAVIGTGTAPAAVTTGTTANIIDASRLTVGIELVGNDGANTLTGGAGDDTVAGNAGIDTFVVTAGTDTITDLGKGGADVLNVSAGATANATVAIAWTASASTVNKGTVNIATSGLAVNLAAVTALTAGNAGYHVTNSGGATTLTGSSLDDWISGGAGGDVVIGGPGADILDGGDGSDIYIVLAATHHGAAEFADGGASGTDEVRFTATTAATLKLYAGDSGMERAVIGTGAAATAVTTGTTGSSIDAGELTAGITLTGNAGANTLTGGWGNDTLQGGAGKDTLYGGAGDDHLRGGAGNDALTGGLGTDLFIFDTASNATSNLDTIVDFLVGTDTIQLSQAIFSGLTKGGLSGDAFWSGKGVTTAHDATDRVIYNLTTGDLYYDADGTGRIAAVKVAIVGTTTHPTLANTDFEIIA